MDSKPRKPTQFNILLLGETGIGKSTFLNAFLNYMSFDSLQAALSSEKVPSIIPTRFSTFNDNFEEITIEYGFDQTNSSHVTKQIKSYQFHAEAADLRFIDTPGLGNTEGKDFDKNTLRLMLQTISNLSQIHCVCIFMKPNETKLNSIFAYALRRYLTCLPPKLYNNIAFIFTHTRSSFYQPGDTLIVLRSVLNDVSEADGLKVRLEENNVFCLDNEAFRYLVAKKQGIDNIGCEDEYNVSWEKSSEACHRLIKHATKLVPYEDLDNILIQIEQIGSPLAQVLENITLNLQTICDERLTVKDETEKAFYVPIISLQVNKLKCPIIICSHPDCTDVKVVNNLTTYTNAVCCKDSTATVNTTSSGKSISLCKYFSKQETICKKCKHESKFHFNVYTMTENCVSYQVSGYQNEDAKTISQKDFIKKRTTDLTEEQKTIEKAALSIQMCLRNLTNGEMNDGYAQYLNILANRKMDEDGKVSGWKTNLVEYEHQKKLLGEVTTKVNVCDVLKPLFSLKTSGPLLKKILQGQKHAYLYEMLTHDEEEANLAINIKLFGGFEKGAKTEFDFVLNPEDAIE